MTHAGQPLPTAAIGTGAIRLRNLASVRRRAWVAAPPGASRPRQGVRHRR